MRIATNKVKDLVSFFHKELTQLYSKEEIDELAFRVFEFYAGFTREDMLKKQDENLNQSELILIYDAAKALATAKPLQYVLGKAYFYKYDFDVTGSVLIPRPETEELVDLIINENKGKAIRAFDIGTGSGCIPITLILMLPSIDMWACDISNDALNVAKLNAQKHQASVNFINADALKLPSDLPMFDLIVSNPPYIKRSEEEQIHKNVKDHEPHLALFVESEDAIVFYKRIIDFSLINLNTGGKLYFELNPLTAEDVKGYAVASNSFNSVELFKDMSGNLRFLKATK
ncbi:MAG: peptide chain release factor N(5)-glutamine methyltransferase [Sphingobacteriaceae bacterium]|jgi:release factor glutamine methyltransferase